MLGIGPYVRDLLEDIDLRRFEVMSDSGLETLPEPAERACRRVLSGCCTWAG